MPAGTMRQRPPFSTRPTRCPASPRLPRYLWALLIGACLGCGSGNQELPPLDESFGSPQLPLDGLIVETLGKLRGPFFLIEVVSPKLLTLGDSQLNSGTFELLGLRDDDYPPQEQEEAALEMDKKTRREYIKELRQYKTKKIEELLGEDPLWVLYQSRRSPPLIYLFRSTHSNSIALKEAPPGPAYLVNAWLLRKGHANMELEGQVHAYYDMMLDSQLTAIAESRRSRKKGPEAEDIWNRFGMSMPDQRYKPRIEAIAKLP